MAKPVPLPRFIQGIPLGASDLMRYAINEEYLYRNAHRLNYPFRSRDHPLPGETWGRALGDDERWIVHGGPGYDGGYTHRYLYYKFLKAVSTTIYIRDQEAVSLNNYGEGSGFIDLHPDGTNPYGLTPGEAYPVKVTGWELQFVMIAETPTNTPPIGKGTLPYTYLPAYGVNSTIHANDLNALTDNLQYLLDKSGLLPVRGFYSDDWKSPADVYYRFTHMNRYLYLRAFSPSGLADEGWFIELFWGRTHSSNSRIFQAYAKLNQGGADVRAIIDLHDPANHRVFTGGYTVKWGTEDTGAWPIPTPLATGTVYDITFRVNHNEDQEPCNDCRSRLMLLVETANDADIVG